MYDPILVTPPTETPVSVDEVKAHLRVIERDGDGNVLPNDDDELIKGYIAAAVSHLDGWSGVLGRCLVEQTWRQDFDSFTQCMRLKLAPVSEEPVITYRLADGTLHTVAAENYAIEITNGGTPVVWFKGSYSRPSGLYERRAVSVQYQAGYGAPADVPRALRHAIMMMVGHWYENRWAVTDGSTASMVPLAVDALITPFRRLSV